MSCGRLYVTKNNQNSKIKLNQPSNVFDFYTQIIPLKIIRTNFIIFIFLWTTYSITINDIYIELESIGGNLYLNIGFIALLEVLSSFVSGHLMTDNDGASNLKKYSLLITGMFSLFLFAPANAKSSLIFLVFMMFGKFFTEIVTSLIYVFAPKYLTDEFTPFFMIIVRLFSRICLGGWGEFY